MHFGQFNDFSISFLFQINKYVEVNVITDSDRACTLSQRRSFDATSWRNDVTAEGVTAYMHDISRPKKTLQNGV